MGPSMFPFRTASCGLRGKLGSAKPPLSLGQSQEQTRANFRINLLTLDFVSLLCIIHSPALRASHVYMGTSKGTLVPQICLVFGAH